MNKSSYPTPAYATEKSAGMDLKADITEPVTLGPLERAMIPTGLFIALPDGTEAQIRPRSGLAAKFGISVLNSPGTIDADYRCTGGDGYLTPLEYEPLWEEKVCRNCGNKIIVEK